MFLHFHDKIMTYFTIVVNIFVLEIIAVKQLNHIKMDYSSLIINYLSMRTINR
jgi:hypothetical protein